MHGCIMWELCARVGFAQGVYKCKWLPKFKLLRLLSSTADSASSCLTLGAALTASENVNLNLIWPSLPAAHTLALGHQAAHVDELGSTRCCAKGRTAHQGRPHPRERLFKEQAQNSRPRKSNENSTVRSWGTKYTKAATMHCAWNLLFSCLLPTCLLPILSRKAATGWNDMPAAPSAHHRAWTKASGSNKVLSKSIQKSYCSVTRLFQAVSSRFKLLSIYLIVPWGRYLQAMKLRSQFAQSAGQHRQLPFDKCSIHFKYSIVYSDIFRIFQNVCKWYKTNACNIL